MVYEKPEPLTHTRYVHEVPERIGDDGGIIEPIDEAAVREAIEALVADGVEALTVSLLNAHANGRHERVVAEIAAAVAPDLPISISSEILPEFREYERTVTTLMNAYVARAALEPGMAIDGYAVVEQYDATTVVLPGHRAVVDPWKNLLIRPEELIR